MNTSSNIDSDIISVFKDRSVIFLPSLFAPSFCKDVRNYILKHELDIIKSYSSDKRGLVCEKVDNISRIKYFEYPFHYDSRFFGSFLCSKVFTLASSLLNSDVRFVSAEIHSRFSGATEIPPHQDNAYYGLNDGNALTFYIALDEQSPLTGGLQYLYNPITDEFLHHVSASPGFSLTIAERSTVFRLPLFSPVYSSGDCSIHHSRSIHFANPVPSGTSRSLVFRLSFYSTSSEVIPEHEERYNKAILCNRNSSQN